MDIDVSDVGSARELHELLAARLRFPDFYGHNWDAFWDCICDPQLSSVPDSLRISGLSELQAKLAREAELFKRALKDAELETGLVVEYVDS